MPAKPYNGTIALFLRSDSLVVEPESTSELGWESTPKGSTIKVTVKEYPDHTTTDRLLLPGPSIPNVSIVVDHTTTFA